MKLIRSVASNFSKLYDNELSEGIINGFNNFEQLAFRILLENSKLDDTALNRKLSKELYKSSPDNDAYKQFKKRFKAKMSRIVSISICYGTEGQKNEYVLIDQYACFIKLLYSGIREPAIKEAKNLVKKAIDLQNYSIARDTAKFIVQNYCTFEDKYNDKKKYDSLYRKAEKLCSLEYESQMIFGKIVECEINNTISQEKKEEFLNAIDTIKPKLVLDSYVYHYYYYQVHLKFAKGAEYLRLCKQAIQYFDNLWYDHSRYTSIFRNRAIAYYIDNNELALAELNLITLLGETKRYSLRWYRYATSMIKVYLRINNIAKAKAWHNKVIRSKKIRSLEKSSRNEFEVLGMFIDLAEDNYKAVNLRKIKYNLNLDSKKPASKNLQYLTAELIYLMKSGDMNVDNKIKALRRKSKENSRLVAFCDSLEKGTKYSCMESTDFQNEIIPYEKLIQMI